MTTYAPPMDTSHQSRRGAPSGYSNGHGGAADMHSHQSAAPSAPLPGQEDPMSSLMGQFAPMGLGPAGPGLHNIPPGTFMNSHDGSIVFAHYPGSGYPMMADHGYSAAAYPLQFSGGYAPAYTHGGMMPYAPSGRPVPYGDRIPRELPVLDNRRSSYSTSATESAPATPYFHGADRGGARVISLERSSFTTPSPRENTNFMAQVKAQDPEMERLVAEEPPIPKAVPAVWTDHTKPLEQCLENRIQGNRNVYIRGLHPTTDDELLNRYTARFGEVEMSKAIIDTVTGACKGFGFAKFKDVRDSEKCIRGFYSRGYEVGFARESFNARLKAEGDEGSTNLYISNLPKDINESTLAQIYEPFHIVSSKILRDSMGNSRGVGFARFESRDVCEKVIKTFHGMAIGQDNYIMQVRYADTPSQKELKRITAERRQYRTNEYNVGAYGTPAVGISPSIYAPASWNRRSQASSTFGQSFTRHSSYPAMTGGMANAAPLTTKKTQPEADAASSDGSGDEGATVVDNSAAGMEAATPKAASLKNEEC